VLIGIISASSIPLACASADDVFSTNPSMTGFIASAYPELIRQALAATDGGGPPAVTTGAASAISSDSAVVTGTVNANTVASQAFFQYSRVSDFSLLDGTITAGDVMGSETATISANLSQLEPGATYYWRIAATNAAGTAVGGTQSFATPTFKSRTSRTTNALLNALVIDRTGISKTVVMPAAKSRLHCAFNSNTKRLTFSRPGTCRVKITITRAGVTTSGNYNLVVR